MGTLTGFPPTSMLAGGFRSCRRLPHEVDNITEFVGIGFLDGGESFVSFETNAALVVLGARHFGNFSHGCTRKVGHRPTGPVARQAGPVFHTKHFIETQTPQQSPVFRARIHNIETSARILEPHRHAGQHAHKGAVHATAADQIQHHMAVPIIDSLAHQRFQFRTVLKTAAAIHS